MDGIEDKTDRKRKERGDTGIQDSPSSRKKLDPDKKIVARTNQARILRTEASSPECKNLNLKPSFTTCETYLGEHKQHAVAGEDPQHHAGHADRLASLGEGALGNTGAVWLEAVRDKKIYGATNGENARQSTPL